MHVGTFAGNVGNVKPVSKVGDTSVLNFSLAVSDKVKGNKVTYWVACAIWGPRADALAPHIEKGMFVVVSGSVTARAYIKDQQPVAEMECRVEQFTFGPSRAEKGEPTEEAPF